MAAGQRIGQLVVALSHKGGGSGTGPTGNQVTVNSGADNVTVNSGADNVQASS